jgi:hypothetical protein
MKLITEICEDLEVFEEEDDGKKSLYLEGIFLQSETKNRNNRIYPRSILEREVGRYKKSYIKENRAFGELGHPEGPTINLERVSHMITQLRRSGDSWTGRAKIMRETPSGKIVEGLLNEGAQLGVSSRGMGSLQDQQDGTKLVADDFYLATAADIVADPSAPNAFVKGIMEGREWMWDNGLLRESDVDRARKTIDKHYNSKDKEEQILKALDTLLSKI